LVEKGGRKKYIQRGMEEAAENGKESSHSAHDNGINVLYIYIYLHVQAHLQRQGEKCI